jgi:hypothetical protein
MKLLQPLIILIPTMVKAYKCQKTKITFINDKNKMEDNINKFIEILN